MDSEKVGLRNKMGIVALTRLKTLYYYVYEMAQAFGVGQSSLDSIEKGVWKRQIIKDIIIKYRNKDDVVLGKVIISIDWEKHKILTTADGSETFKFSSEKSIHSQISEVSDILIEHVNKMRKSLPITRITTSYYYIDEIDYDEEALEAARAFLGHVPGTEDVVDIESEFTHTMSHIAKLLEEVEITIKS